jgi:hypothetical protein
VISLIVLVEVELKVSHYDFDFQAAVGAIQARFFCDPVIEIDFGLLAPHVMPYTAAVPDCLTSFGNL